MEVERVSEDKKAFVVRVCRVCLYLHLILLEKLPVFAILQTGLHEDAVLVRGEVLPAHDLANKMHFRLKVRSCAHLCTHLLHHV